MLVTKPAPAFKTLAVMPDNSITEVSLSDYKGKKVVLNPLITCGDCEYCKLKKEHLCTNRVLLGMNKPIERQGGFAELVLVPDKNIYELPKGLDMNKYTIGYISVEHNYTELRQYIHQYLLSKNYIHKFSVTKKYWRSICDIRLF